MSTPTDDAREAAGAPVELRIGARLRSTACDTEVIVVSSPGGPVSVGCGGHPMVEPGGDVARLPIVDGHDGGSLVGKRYGADGLELLCVVAGVGSLSVDGRLLEVAAAKHLPSSD